MLLFVVERALILVDVIDFFLRGVVVFGLCGDDLGPDEYDRARCLLLMVLLMLLMSLVFDVVVLLALKREIGDTLLLKNVEGCEANKNVFFFYDVNFFSFLRTELVRGEPKIPGSYNCTVYS